MFVLLVNVALPGCSGTPEEYTASSGTIQSPGYAESEYPDNAHCQWLITASAGNVRIVR